MSGPTDTSADAATKLGAAALRSLHEARVQAELADADALLPGSDSSPSTGAHFADIAVVKGLPGPAEASGKPAMSGADGDAACKALGALGWDSESIFFLLSRPGVDTDPVGRAARLRLQVESVDPEFVLAVDAEAAADIAAAFGIDGMGFGEVLRVGGRRFAACDGLEASLGDPARKRRVWTQLKLATPYGSVY